jgi:hypothetical protein
MIHQEAATKFHGDRVILTDTLSRSCGRCGDERGRNRLPRPPARSDWLLNEEVMQARRVYP